MNDDLSFWHEDQARAHVMAWRDEVARRERTIDGFIEGRRRARPGDLVTKCHYSDRDVYEVVEVSPSGKTLTLHPVEAKLLNGPTSGEPDALHFSPGGFCGHMSGTQRYEYTRIEPKDPRRFSKVRWSAKRKRYQAPGGHPSVIAGAHQHYDYNF